MRGIVVGLVLSLSVAWVVHAQAGEPRAVTPETAGSVTLEEMAIFRDLLADVVGPARVHQELSAAAKKWDSIAERNYPLDKPRPGVDDPGMETKTFSQVRRFTDAEAREYLEAIRWPTGPCCVHCGSVNVARLEGSAHRAGVLKCREKGCRKQFTVTVGTIFQGSHIPLSDWVTAFYIVCASKKAVSALQLKRQLGLGSYKSAWHMAHRIRTALAHGPHEGPLSGRVECDEVYVGGKPRRFSPSVAGGKGRVGRGTARVPVFVLVERGGRARSMPMTKVDATALDNAIRANVTPDARLNTDEYRAYRAVGCTWPGGHDVIKHAEKYADGLNHVNTAESYNGLVKRCVMGAWHHISRKHMQKYLNEISFRWSHRKATDSERAVTALRQGDGVRLVYRQG